MSRTLLNKTQYIGGLKQCLSARDDFKDLVYRRTGKGKEYLILSDIIGNILMLDITGYDEAEIFHAIAQIECKHKPKCLIEDKAEKLRVARSL